MGMWCDVKPDSLAPESVRLTIMWGYLFSGLKTHKTKGVGLSWSRGEIVRVGNRILSCWGSCLLSLTVASVREREALLPSTFWMRRWRRRLAPHATCWLALVHGGGTCLAVEMVEACPPLGCANLRWPAVLTMVPQLETQDLIHSNQHVLC